MKAVPCRDVYRHDKFILEKQLDPDKIEQRELLALIIIDKQIKIAIGSGFVGQPSRTDKARSRQAP